MAVHSKQTLVSSWIANDIPIGDIDGVNQVFELNYTPINEIILRLNGIVTVPGIDKEYVLSGTTITFNKAPKVGMNIVASYFGI